METDAKDPAKIAAKIDTMRAQAVQPCLGGGVETSAGKGCDYSDPAATALAKKGGAWLPWY